VAGGFAGKAIGEEFDPTREEEHWRQNYRSRPYVESGLDYDTHYLPAYRYGWEAQRLFPGRSFDEIEPELERDWLCRRLSSTLDWEQARHATRDAWERSASPFTVNK
jgi:hypothetical protein